MIEKNRIVYIIVAVLVAVTLIHVGYRLFRRDSTVPRFPGSQGERLETWNNMRRLALTDENISEFVDALLSSPTLPPPRGMAEVSFVSLTESHKTDAQEALVGFLMAYRENEPGTVYDYLANSRAPTQLPLDVKKSIQDIARQSGHSLPLETDAAAFLYLWSYLESNGIGWEFLLEGSGASCFWETNVPLTPEASIQLVLTDPALFGSITSRGHMFDGTLRLNEVLTRGNRVVFCDVFFVTELNKAKDHDFCAIGVRFWFDEAAKKWVPYTLALVTPEIRQDLQFPF